MAKFSGKIGFVVTNETPENSGIYLPTTVERKYFGDILTHRTRYEPGEGTNSDIQLNTEISVVADSFAERNLGFMRYVTLHGTKWAITAARITYPRINLTIGGVYNGAPT